MHQRLIGLEHQHRKAARFAMKYQIERGALVRFRHIRRIAEVALNI